jgi:hypothetical protein
MGRKCRAIGRMNRTRTAWRFLLCRSWGFPKSSVTLRVHRTVALLMIEAFFMPVANCMKPPMIAFGIGLTTTSLVSKRPHFCDPRCGRSPDRAKGADRRSPERTQRDDPPLNVSRRHERPLVRHRGGVRRRAPNLVAEFARFQGAVTVCRSSGEFRYGRVGRHRTHVPDRPSR